jgi:hypothetical protein
VSDILVCTFLLIPILVLAVQAYGIRKYISDIETHLGSVEARIKNAELRQEAMLAEIPHETVYGPDPEATNSGGMISIENIFGGNYDTDADWEDMDRLKARANRMEAGL